jgi:hypothetical protein
MMGPLSSYDAFLDISASYADAFRECLTCGPLEGVERIRQLCEAAPDADHLLVIAVEALDTLLDQHWAVVESVFEEAMKQSPALRRCWSCAMPDMPQGAIDRLDSLLLPGEDIGRQGAWVPILLGRFAAGSSSGPSLVSTA